MSASTFVDRFVYRPRPDGPHARLGVVWFVTAAVACAVGTVAVAALFASVAAVAALGAARTWQASGRRVAIGVCALSAVVAAPAALLGGTALVIGAAASVIVAVVGGLLTASNPFVVLRSSFVPGATAGAVVLLGRVDMGALVILLVLVSAYETGDYLMGAEADSIVEGPVSGMAAVMVLTFAVAVGRFGPFESGAVWVFGALVAVLAPLGALVASALVPSATAAGPALRRLDAWMIVTPVWAWLLLVQLGRIG